MNRTFLLLAVGLLALGAYGQNYRTAHINVLRGQPYDTAFVATTNAVQDGIPDSTYAIALDSSGTGQATVQISVDDVSLAEDMLEHVNYYPNPFNNQINLTYDRTVFPELAATVFNTAGQQVGAFHHDEGKMELKLNGPDGLYIVSLQSEYAQAAFRVIKSSQAPGAISPVAYESTKKSSFTLDSLDADFRFTYNPRRNDSTIGRSMTAFDTVLTRNNTYNFDLNQLSPVWDTAFANGIINVFDKVNFPNFVPNADITLKPKNIKDISVLDTFTNNTASAGGIAYSNLITDIDTTGLNQHDTATYKISWPFVNNPGFDSTSATPSFPGWVAGDTLVKFGEGNNGVTNLFLVRETNPNIAGKKYYSFRVGVLKNGSPNSLNSIADSALVVFYNITQNTTDSLWTTSSTTTLPNGIEYNAITSTPYNHNDTLNIAIGAPNDTALKGYTGMQYVVTGSSYNDIANGDTIETVMANLVPATLYSGLNDTLVQLSGAEIKDMHESTYYHGAVFDTIPYYFPHGEFTPSEEQILISYKDSMSNITPVTYVHSTNPINLVPYNTQTATAMSHGIVVRNGTNNTVPSGIPTDLKGENTMYTNSTQYISVLPNPALKEEFQSTGHGGVSTTGPIGRSSIMNGNPNNMTNKDIAIYTLKHNIEKEMYKQSPTQNISINYLTDADQVVP